jgi:asparagine synthase (glutamine-hydrolysing)
MCGICGVVHFDNSPVAKHDLERMVKTIHHRGPDDAGVWVDGNAGLGNTRLAIIDLSQAGHQPLSNEAGDVWIAFNGEIYNFKHLRDDVVRPMHKFRSHTDTETIVHLFEDQGIGCLELLRGMFALAIWDGRKRELWLARDRLGKKPLYYYQDSKRFVFGSEIKTILEYLGVRRELNRDVIPLYLAYGYVPAPETIFKGIKMLRAGCWLKVKEGNVEEKEYWSPPPPIVETRGASLQNEREWCDALISQLREAVRLRLISDVPLGAFLSGGLDSSAVVALMAEESATPVKTFAIGFSGEPSYDETSHARVVANHLKTEHHEFIVEPDAIDLIEKLTWHLDQPFGDSSAIPTYLVSKLARDHVTVALNGDGGDELFAGYERFYAARLAQQYQRVPKIAHNLISGVASRLPQGTGYRDVGRRASRFVNTARQELPDQYLGWVGIMSDDLAERLCGRARAADHFKNYFRARADGDPVPALLDVNMRSYLPDDLLIKADRMSMAASLEARSPFLDHVLVEFAATIPSSLKLKGSAGKYILKRAFENRLPREIIYRRKHGFGVPIGKWFRATLRDYLNETLLSTRAAQRGVLRTEAVQQLVNEHLSGARDHGHALWTVMMLEVWARRFLD